jgi:hypothetical protein
MRLVERSIVGAALLALTTIAGAADAQVFFSGGYVSITSSGPAQTASSGPYENTTPPGPQIATLTIADGSTGTSRITETPLLVSSTASSVMFDEVQVNSRLDYTLDVVGPAGQIALPFTATLHTAGSSDPNHPYVSYYSATSTLRIGYQPGAPDISACSSNETSCANPSDATVSSSVTVMANTDDTVDEYTTVSAEDYNATATATADPIFTLTPAEKMQGYTLVVTPGVANGAVPEPAAWALMLAGFGLLGAAVRGRGRTELNPSIISCSSNRR